MDIHFKDLIDTPATSRASCSRQIAFICHNDPPESATVLSSSCASWSSQVAAHFTSIHLIYVLFLLDRLHRCLHFGIQLAHPIHCGTAWCWEWISRIWQEWIERPCIDSAYLLSRSALQDAWCFYAQSSPFSLSVIPHFHGSKLNGVSTSFSPLTRVYEQHNK